MDVGRMPSSNNDARPDFVVGRVSAGWCVHIRTHTNQVKRVYESVAIFPAVQVIVGCTFLQPAPVALWVLCK
jgi:hypothetical protein